MPFSASASKTSQQGSAHSTGRLVAIVFFSVCLILVVVGYAFTRPLEDFVEYWSAGHLLAARGNPYSPIEMFNYERALGWQQPLPLIPLNPPWALLFFAPFGFFHSYALAWLVWVGILLILVAISSRVLMDVYFGDLKLPEISDRNVYRFLFALSFYPVLLSLKFAQAAPLVLLGVVGFLFFEREGRPFAAGSIFALTAIKPNLVYLVWLAMFLQFFRRGHRRTIIAAVGMVVAAFSLTLIIDPHAMSQYLSLVRSPFPRDYLPGIAGAVRTLFRKEGFVWLQLIPPLTGLVWFGLYWSRNRTKWNWTEHMPMLIAASILTTPYGWLFDQVLLAVPIIALAGKYAREFGNLPKKIVLLYTALNVILILLAMVSSPWGFLPAPMLIAIILYRESRLRGQLSDNPQFIYARS